MIKSDEDRRWRAPDTLRDTLLLRVAAAGLSQSRGSRPTREGIPALVIHTRHFNYQITTKSGLFGFREKPARSFNSLGFTWNFGSGSRSRYFTDAIDADRKSGRLPIVRVYYRARQKLMIGLWNSGNRRTHAGRSSRRATTWSPPRRRASPVVLSGSSTLQFRFPHTRLAAGASCFL